MRSRELTAYNIFCYLVSRGPILKMNCCYAMNQTHSNNAHNTHRGRDSNYCCYLPTSVILFDAVIKSATDDVYSSFKCPCFRDYSSGNNLFFLLGWLYCICTRYKTYLEIKIYMKKKTKQPTNNCRLNNARFDKRFISALSWNQLQNCRYMWNRWL